MNEYTKKVIVIATRSSDGFMRLSIKDESSRIEFVEVKIALEEFTKMITATYAEGMASYNGLLNVGKTKITEDREVECPPHIRPYDKDELKAWLIETRQEDGWILDSYLRSQSSIITKNKKTVINYHVYKYV